MLEFKLPDMTCGHCASTVTKTCQSVDPDAKVEVDLKSKMAKVESGGEGDRFARALTQAGYPPAG